jgi:hypothetical protein
VINSNFPCIFKNLREGDIKENGEGGKFKYDIFDLL